MQGKKENYKATFTPNYQSAADDRFKAFVELRKTITKNGFQNNQTVSAKTIYPDLNGFRFDQQSAQGNRIHYALQQNGKKGKTNIATITIQNINDKQEVQAIIEGLNTFQANLIHKQKCCFDFSARKM